MKKLSKRQVRNRQVKGLALICVSDAVNTFLTTNSVGYMRGLGIPQEMSEAVWNECRALENKLWRRARQLSCEVDPSGEKAVLESFLTD